VYRRHISPPYAAILGTLAVAAALVAVRRACPTEKARPMLASHGIWPTGITAYLKNGGTLKKAAAMTNHTSTRTTQLYDRRRDEVSLDEVERIAI